MSDQFVSEAATHTTLDQHNRRTSMSSTRFEPAIPAFKRQETQVLDRKATGIGQIHFQSGKIQQLKFAQYQLYSAKLSACFMFSQ
jgi:hypothetical protein